MDPHSIKRQRIAPPSPTSSPVQTPFFTAPPLSHDHSREITLTQLPISKTPSEYNSTLSRQPSFSRRHSKDTLFHKDTHHRHLPEQQQQQQQHQQQQEGHAHNEEWSPLRKAHEEFHQQRIQYLAKERQLKRRRQLERQQQQLANQQQQIRLQQQQFQNQQEDHHDKPSLSEPSTPQSHRPTSPSSSSPIEPQPPQFQTPSSSPSQSAVPPSPENVHPHSHYHFFSHGQHGLRFQQFGNIHNRPTPAHLMPHQQQRRHAPHPTAATFLRLSPPTNAPGVTGNASSISPFSPYFGRRTQQFSDWLAVKERERARVESNLMRLRDQQQQQQHSGSTSSHAAKDNLKRLQQKIQQRRARTRATLLYDLHQGVKSVEAQVQKQVEMVLSRLKEAPGSRYAFALTNTFLNTIPSALSQTIIPSAISAVAATAASKATNMTALRDYDEHDDDDDDDDEDDDAEEGEDDEDDEEKMWFLWQLQQQQFHQDICYSRFSGQQPLWLQQRILQQNIQSQSAEHLSNEFGTIAIAPSSSSSSERGSVPPSAGTMDVDTEPVTPRNEAEAVASSAPASSSSPSIAQASSSAASTSNESQTKTVHISSEDASVLLSAGMSTTYASAASAVLSAAASAGLATIDSTLPSLIPTVVAPIVCVFSYPTPPASKTTSPQASSPSSPNDGNTQPRKENLYESLVRDHSAPNLSSKAAFFPNSPPPSSASTSTASQPMKSYDQVPIKKEEVSETIQEISPRPIIQLSKSTAWTKAEREALFLAVTRFKLFGQWTKIKEMMNLHRTEEEIEREYRRLYVDDDMEDSDLEDEQEDDGRDSCRDGDDEEDDGDMMDFSSSSSEEADNDADIKVQISSSSSSTSSSPHRRSNHGSSPRIVDGVNINQLPKKARREFLRHRAMMKRALKQQKPIRLSEKEFLIDKRFHLEEIPMHL
ncbi:hypothetical protein BGW42_000023 [Actinomortierella wolfii]|nr:hypothetical protein BGW42_000023 [Actinomortierella wolfii]